MSGQLVVTAIIVAKDNGTAEDCSDAFNDFSEQHQLEDNVLQALPIWGYWG